MVISRSTFLLFFLITTSHLSAMEQQPSDLEQLSSGMGHAIKSTLTQGYQYCLDTALLHSPYEQVCTWLLKAGANPNTQGYWLYQGVSPLTLAIYNDDPYRVQMLLEYGANPNAEDNRNCYGICRDILSRPTRLLSWVGLTPLIYAITHTTPTKNDDKNTSYLIAELLLQWGAGANVPDKQGSMPLMHAAQVNRIEFVDLLMRYKADIHATTKEGCTALHCAAYAGNVEVIEALLRHGANINAQTKFGHTPLVMAAFMGKLEAVKLLLANGANATLKDYGDQVTQASPKNALEKVDDLLKELTPNDELYARLTAIRDVLQVALWMPHGSKTIFKGI